MVATVSRPSYGLNTAGLRNTTSSASRSVAAATSPASTAARKACGMARAYRRLAGRREARILAGLQRAHPLAHVLAEEREHLVRGARVEGGLRGTDPVVQR